MLVSTLEYAPILSVEDISFILERRLQAIIENSQMLKIDKEWQLMERSILCHTF